MSFFVGEGQGGRTEYYNVDRAVSVAHDVTSVDRARWVVRFGFFFRKTIIIEEQSQASKYDKLNRYFSENSTGV